ncbi:hypothetical protein [Leucobacter sp. wl10]|uniref:hypothetical protein n=1 Tax=Leucobacter sp. wl10 TaxID=2304677 RepID=UPI000E5BA025|nr:hypothetical protein [Leucobacter sp. wl10]RGE19018.1 hypothetical protein D1J51_12880 [Leucobacter sp. wl10]
MGHRSYEPRRELEALLNALEGILVRSALFEGLSQREIAAELDTSKSRVNRLANETEHLFPLRDAVGYGLATRMLSSTPIVEIAAARCWSAGLRESAAVTLAELRDAVDLDLSGGAPEPPTEPRKADASDPAPAGASVRSVSMALPTPGTEEAELLLGMLWDWSRRAFLDVAPGAEELRVGVYIPQGVEEASSLLPRVPASTVAALLGVPVADVPSEWLDNGLRTAGIAATSTPTQ